MEKMLILALITLFYIVSSALVPPQTVPVDKDVGICMVAPMYQVADVVMYVADNSIISLPDPRSALLSGVEKSDYTITLNSQIDVQYVSLDLRQTTPAKMTNLQGSNSINRDLGGLLTEYVSPRDGAKSRHT